MKILLDIDGVLVSAASWRKPIFLDDDFPSFISESVRVLNEIILEVNGEIILTTSHKDKYSKNEWLSIFRKRGIIISDIEKLPENDNFLNRKDEILRWIDYNREGDFIIIDDDKSLNDLPIGYKNKLVLTSSIIGLSKLDLERFYDVIHKIL